MAGQAQAGGSTGVSTPQGVSAQSLASAAVAGFIATAVMSIVLLAGYGLATSIGSDDPSEVAVLRWMHGLSQTQLTQDTQNTLPAAAGINFVIGIGWAVLYAAFFASRLHGPYWRRGMTFSLLPWVLSLTVFFPLVGGGLLGLDFGAGPLPLIGILVLHLTYGAVLGQMYGPWGDRFPAGSSGAGSQDLKVKRSGERAVAIGLVVGFVGGAAIGLLLFAFGVLTTSATAAVVLGAIAGSLAGALGGSFAGLSPPD